jgi:hypothetical protein
MKGLAAVAVAVASLIASGCMKAAAAPTLDSFLADLRPALSAADSASKVRAVLNTASAEVSLTDSTSLDDALNLQLRFPSREASWLVATWQLDRSYAVSTDPHQVSWRLALYQQDVSDPYNARIAIGPIRFGKWSITPRLEGRPEGAPPKMVAGASPAYDLAHYSARVVGIDIAGPGS